jgi:hypothetical protein
MNISRNFKASLIVAALMSFSAAQAATLTKAEYKAEKTRISADYKVDKNACDALKDNAKDVCVQEAKAKESVARAELEHSYTGKPADQTKVLQAKAKSAYAVAKEKCDDQEGNAKDVCVKEAKALETKALADAKMGKQIGEAKKEAAEDKSDANYKVATEKCDAMTGDAKTSCVAAAKTKFGKN